MTRILLVTNDFPPRRGGIQSYLEQFANRLAALGEHQLVVYAPQLEGRAGLRRRRRRFRWCAIPAR